MKKILILDNSIYITGAIRSIVAYAINLSDRFSFEFIMNPDGVAAQFVRESGFTVHGINFLEVTKSWRSFRYPFRLYVNAKIVLHLADRVGAAVIHINDLYNQIGVLCKILQPGRRIVYHVRLTSESYLKRIYPVFVMSLRLWADAIVCVSNAAGAHFLDSPKATLIYDSLHRGAKLPPKNYERTEAGYRFLYVGNYVRGKGQDLAIEAFAKIAGEIPDATLRFVGDGVSGRLDRNFVAMLASLVAQCDLSGRVVFDGPVSDVESVMKESDIVLNLSESESFSMVCLEALTYGLPLIASDCGGPREIIDNEINGLLVANRRADLAAAAMFRMVTEPGLAERLGTAGPISIKSKFSLKMSANKLAEVYDQLAYR